MSINDSDQPLGEQFLQNPYEYFQSYVRNMNNEVFLSEYQLNHLYALLLLRKQSPWDHLKPNSSNLKVEIQEMVNLKVADVKKVLESLSQMYEDKLKKNTFTQLERLMNILKSKNKSIYIEKDMQNCKNSIYNLMGNEGRMLKHLIQQKLMNNEDSSILQMQTQKQNVQQTATNQNPSNQQSMDRNTNKNSQPENQREQVQKLQRNQNSLDNKMKTSQRDQQQLVKSQNEGQTQKENDKQAQKERDSGDEREVLSLFYGIANIPNLSALALGNCLEYSAAQRFIKFKMSKNYIMTIKNQDELSFDRTSSMRNVSTTLFVQGIFPYLTAIELFKARGVCKQWMENVKQAWHSTFKREMFVQLMACQFCKEIEFYYKLIQLRNPFFQKISLLMHALLQIIQWDRLYESINNNTLLPQLKKVLIIMLKLLGENIVAINLNSITEQVWQQHKEKTLNLKLRIGQFLNNIESSGLNIIDLVKIKLQLLDDPFMRVEQLNSEDKTPLLLVIFIKQLTLQQILKNHIYFSQEYLMKTKNRLDNVSSKMPQQKGFLQGVYKIILLRNFGGRNQGKQDDPQERTQMPNFSTILSSIFSNSEQSKPDFVLKSRSSLTNIYMDKATKFDIIFSTVKKMNAFDVTTNRDPENQNQVEVQTETMDEGQRMQEQHEQQEGRQSSSPKNNLKSINTYNVVVKPDEKNKSFTDKGLQVQDQNQIEYFQDQSQNPKE